MTIRQLKNISVSQFESFLELAQCVFVRKKGGHSIYSRCDCNRPIVFQNHIQPVPEFILKNNLRVLSYSKDDFFNILEGLEIVEREGDIFKFQIKDK